MRQVDPNQLKILLVDLELAYALYYGFPSKKPQFMPARNIKHHQFCICAAWKWHHEVSVQSISVLEDEKRFKKNFRDDYIVAKKLHELFEEADVIVAHNGDSFDLKHANTLFIKHGLGPVPQIKSIDTLKLARKYFSFPGNGLNDLLTFFNLPGKLDGPSWIGLTEGVEKEIIKAVKYCRGDIRALERLFVKIRPYARNLPALRPIKDVCECAACSSKLLKNHGTRFDGSKFYVDIRCLACGHAHKGKPKGGVYAR